MVIFKVKTCINKHTQPVDVNLDLISVNVYVQEHIVVYGFKQICEYISLCLWNIVLYPMAKNFT